MNNKRLTAARTRTMMRAAVLVLALLFHWQHGIAAEEDRPPQTVEELRSRIESIIEQTKTPAIGIALVNADGPYWVAGFGKADVEADKRADENTLFRIGSISKMFAALAILKLEEEGRLSLDDKVRDHLPDLAYENPWEDTHPIRIAHLLEHTTGWDDIHATEYAYVAPDSMTLAEALAYHPHSRKSRWVPGTRHAYNNAGPAVAAHIVERITGQRFEDYVAATFFAPLGMESTSYFRTDLYRERGAQLYVGPLAQPYWQLIYRPSGAINSSAADMAKLVHFLLLRGATPSAPIVSASAIDRMETPCTTLGAAVGVEAGYGLANFTSGYRNFNRAFHGHNGGMMGALAELTYSKELGQGFVIMINSSNGAAMGRISELLRGYILRDASVETPPARPLPPQFRELDGYYKPLNHRVQMLAFMLNLVSVLEITSDETSFHRHPLFGGWTSNDYAADEQTLIDAWHGLPAIAIVEDPLAGTALQVGSELWKRVPAWRVFVPLGVPLLVVAMTLIGFIALLVWCYRRFAAKTSQDRRLWMRLWPLISTGLLFMLVMMIVSIGAMLQYVGTISPVSIGILLLSLAYPATVLFGVFELARHKNRTQKNLPYWYAAVFAVAHLSIVAYLASYGLIGIRTWA